MPSRCRSRGRALIVLCLLPAVMLAQAPPPVEDLRERATAYVDQFIARFASVVAEERLVQEPPRTGTSTATPSRWTGARCAIVATGC